MNEEATPQQTINNSPDEGASHPLTSPVCYADSSELRPEYQIVQQDNAESRE